MWSGYRVVTLLVALLVVTSGAAGATSRIWDGGPTGSWSEPANWAPDGVPDNGDSAQISGATVTVDGSFAVGSLELLAGTFLDIVDSKTLEVAGPALGIEDSSISLGSGSDLEIKGSVVCHGDGIIYFGTSSTGLTRDSSGGSLTIPDGASLRFSGAAAGSRGEISVPITNQGVVTLFGDLELSLLANMNQSPSGEFVVSTGATLALGALLQGGLFELVGSFKAIGMSAALYGLDVQGNLRGEVEARLRIASSSEISVVVDLHLASAAELILDGRVRMGGSLDCLGPQPCTISAYDGIADILYVRPLSLHGPGEMTLGSNTLMVEIDSFYQLEIETSTTAAGSIEGSGKIIVRNNSVLTLFSDISGIDFIIDTGRIDLGVGSVIADSTLVGGPFVVMDSGRIVRAHLIDTRFELVDGSTLYVQDSLSGKAAVDFKATGSSTGIQAVGEVHSDALLTLRPSSSTGNFLGGTSSVNRIVNDATGVINVVGPDKSGSHLVGGRALASGGVLSINIDNYGKLNVSGMADAQILRLNEGTICVFGGTTAAASLTGSGRLSVDSSDSQVEILSITDGVLAEEACGGGAGLSGKAAGPAGFVAVDGSRLTDATNLGTIVVPDGATVNLMGSLHNVGELLVKGDTVGSTLRIGHLIGQEFLLDGGGMIDLGDSPNTTVDSGNENRFLVNQNNTIRGAALFHNPTCFGGFNVTNRGTLLADGINPLVFGDCSALVNQGSLEVVAGSAVSSDSNLPNHGEINVGSGASLTVDQRLNNHGRLNSASGASLTAYELRNSEGTADIEGSFDGILDLRGGNLTLAGTVGNYVGNSGGTLRIGNGIAVLQVDAQFYNGGTGMLEIDLGPVDHDLVRTTPTTFNATTLGGTVSVRSVNGFEPTPGQEFTFFEYGWRTGQFDSVFNATLYPLTWELIYGDTLNGTVTLRAQPAAPGPDLELEMVDLNDPVGPGAIQTYRLTVTNNGPFTATGVTVENELPPQTTFVSALPSAGSCGDASGVVTCNIGNIGVGASKQVVVKATVDPAFVGFLWSEASAFALETDPIPMDNSDEEDSSVIFGLIFAAGFESADTAAWSAATP